MTYGIWVNRGTLVGKQGETFDEGWDINGMGVLRSFVSKADAEQFAIARRRQSMPGITYTVKELKE